MRPNSKSLTPLQKIDEQKIVVNFGLYHTHITEPLFNAEEEGMSKEECLAAFVESSAEVRRISELGFTRHQK